MLLHSAIYGHQQRTISKVWMFITWKLFPGHSKSTTYELNMEWCKLLRADGQIRADLHNTLRPKEILFLFLRHFFEKTNARGRNFFIVSDCFSCFPVDSKVYCGDFIYIAFNNKNIWTARWNPFLMFYNITRAAVTIAFNTLRNVVVWSNLQTLYYHLVSTIRKKYQGILS